VESGGYSDFGDDFVVCGSDVEEDDGDGDDMTVVSETSWNDPIDEVDGLLSDDSKGASFRRKDCEGMFFKPSIFFGYWKNVKAFTSAKLPHCFSNHKSHLEQQFPRSSFQENTALFNAIGSVNNVCLTQLHSFLAASFLPVSVGPKSAHYVAPISMGSPFPQFSVASTTRSKFKCEICIPYQKWAQNHNSLCARLKSKTATQDQIAKGTAYLMFSGLRQLYEHAISKSHREAIDFFLDKSDESAKPKSANAQQKKEKQPMKLQSNLHSFFSSSHSLN